MNQQHEYLYDAFVSYSSVDHSLVQRTLLSPLRAAGLRIAISDDVKDLGPTGLREIERIITHSKRVVVVLSPSYISDRRTKIELEFAVAHGQSALLMEHGDPIIPVMLLPVTQAQLPSILWERKYADLTQPATQHGVIQGLIRVLRREVATHRSTQLGANDSIHRTAQPSSRKFNRGYAIIVGVANYQQIQPLPKTILNDAHDLVDLLIAPDLCGYPEANVIQLIDSSATRIGILDALDNLIQRVSPDDSVIVFFAGYGGRIETGSFAGTYLLPVDALTATDQLIAQTALSGDMLVNKLRAFPTRQLALILDCCHPYALSQPKSDTSSTFITGLPDRFFDQLIAGGRSVVLASSRNTEYAWTPPNANNSLFMQYLLAGLRGQCPSEDGMIRIFDLFEYIQPRVTRDHPQQHPICKTKLEENFPVALYLGGRKAEG